MRAFTILSALMLGSAILTATGVAIAQDDHPAKHQAKVEQVAPAEPGTPAQSGEKAPAGAEKETSQVAAPGDPEKVLTDKGLTRDKKKYLLDEAAAIDKFEESQTLYTQYQNALMKNMTIADYEENLAALNSQWQTMQQQANALQQQINGSVAAAGRFRGLVNANNAPLRQKHAQLVAEANQMRNQATAMQKRAPKPAERDAASAEVDKARQAYIDAVGELDKLVSPLMAKYHDLGKDKSVIDALVQLNNKASANYKLGPTDELRSAAKVIKDLKSNTAGPARSKASKKKETPRSTPP
jgi:hypothetical protein